MQKYLLSAIFAAVTLCAGTAARAALPLCPNGQRSYFGYCADGTSVYDHGPTKAKASSAPTVPTNEAVSKGWEMLAAKNYDGARTLFEQAANQGDVRGEAALGWYFANNENGQRDWAASEKWFGKSAAQGDAFSQYRLGLMIYYGGSRGVPDHKSAVDWFRKAANQGYAEAQSNMAGIYDAGEVVPHDPSQVLMWNRKAAAQGNPSGLLNLGQMLLKGKGVKQDRSEGLRLIQQAANTGDAYSEYFLGNMYANGDGFAKNQLEAEHWMHKAADDGISWAKDWLAKQP